MKKNIALCIVFSILTCGIYTWYWIVCLADGVNEVTGHSHATSGGLVLLFTLLTCGLYGLYWLYKSGDALDRLREEWGRSKGHLGILYLLLSVLGLSIISYALMQSELNEYAAA